MRQLREVSAPYNSEIRALACPAVFELPDKHLLEMDSGWTSFHIAALLMEKNSDNKLSFIDKHFIHLIKSSSYSQIGQSARNIKDIDISQKLTSHSYTYVVRGGQIINLARSENSSVLPSPMSWLPGNLNDSVKTW